MLIVMPPSAQLVGRKGHMRKSCKFVVEDIIQSEEGNTSGEENEEIEKIHTENNETEKEIETQQKTKNKKREAGTPSSLKERKNKETETEEKLLENKKKQNKKIHTS